MTYKSSVFNVCNRGDDGVVGLFLNGNTSSSVLNEVIRILDENLSAKEQLVNMMEESQKCTNCGEGIMVSSGELCNACYC